MKKGKLALPDVFCSHSYSSLGFGARKRNALNCIRFNFDEREEKRANGVIYLRSSRKLMSRKEEATNFRSIRFGDVDTRRLIRTQ